MTKKFNKYADLDDVATRVALHLSRALLVCSVLADEAEEIDIETEDACCVRNTMRRSVEFSEIIFDYLAMMKDEIEELRGLVNELLDVWRSEKGESL